ncbi:hypothetical protein [Paradevosia shaoguanensis]|uniref:hypothetical protein n=1 Tax=Paradevosia shaoguanensis TaxID=1335043 RepID=UPI001933B42B|nr:hypothetical protein [Paradevosia shaoguanensis]
MKKLSALLLAGVFAAAVPGLAAAQDANVGAQVKAGAQDAAGAVKDAAGEVKDAAGNAMQAAGDAMKSAAAAAIATTDDLAAKITAGASADVKAINETTNVKFVALSSLKVGGAADAVADHTDWLNTLRADVAANAALNAKLEAAGYKADQVVYADAGEDGSVTVYVDDKVQ